jgi:uncharacterized protein YkwD
MSDNYAIRRYHRQTMTVTGTSRKKKYLRIFLILLLAGVIGAVYLVCSSGILADENPRIPQHMITRINLERQANSLAPVRMDDYLANLALAKGREVKISSQTYLRDAAAGNNENVFVIPKISWALSGYDEQQQMFDALENNDNSFRTNVLNGNFRNLGIGVTSDGYNYYIAMKWQ